MMSPKRPRSSTVLILLATLFAAACGANESILKSGKETPSPSIPAPPAGVSTFTSDLEAMRTAGFTSIYILRRRDGQPMNSEDRAVIRQNTEGVNRRVASDSDRAILIGSNYQIPAENLKVMFERFAVEDQSPPPQPAPSAASNANANK